MKDNIGRKGLVLGIILLFVGAGVIPSSVSVIEKKTALTSSISPGYIQGLIDNASSGDTIFIPNGTYYENIIINKSISLIGEDKKTTIIDGSEIDNVVRVNADWVNISEFTLKNSGTVWNNAGIYVTSDYNAITGNNISSNNGYGIYLGIGTRTNTITNNTINSNNYHGIVLDNSAPICDTTIANNTINSNNYDGIHLFLSSGNTITGNNISLNNDYGIYLGGSSFNNITGNTISDNDYGLYLIFLRILSSVQLSRKNTIIKNNFLSNKRHAFCGGDWTNTWMENYWNKPRSLPKLIFGKISIGPIGIPWFNFDWHPAREPYDIEV